MDFGVSFLMFFMKVGAKPCTDPKLNYLLTPVFYQMPNPLDFVASLEKIAKVIRYLFFNQQIREIRRETKF